MKKERVIQEWQKRRIKDSEGKRDKGSDRYRRKVLLCPNQSSFGVFLDNA